MSGSTYHGLFTSGHRLYPFVTHPDHRLYRTIHLAFASLHLSIVNFTKVFPAASAEHACPSASISPLCVSASSIFTRLHVHHIQRSSRTKATENGKSKNIITVSVIQLTPLKVIGTHNGTFHCDEALAVFLLRQTPTYRDAGTPSLVLIHKV